jgi:RP/EB family microtubule-associated protein
MAPFMAPSTSSAYSAATVTRETRPAPSNDRVVGMMDAAYFVGRRELLDWINTTLELNVQRIEDTCSGAVACQLMDCIQPNTVPMSKVNWGAKDEYAMICNYKLLQSAFDRARVSKPVEVNRLIRGKYQDNLEFMQWCVSGIQTFPTNSPERGEERTFGQLKPRRTASSIGWVTSTRNLQP